MLDGFAVTETIGAAEEGLLGKYVDGLSLGGALEGFLVGISDVGTTEEAAPVLVVDGLTDDD